MLITPMTAPTIQGERGERLSLRMPASSGLMPVAKCQVSPYRLMYLPRLSAGARLAAKAVAVGTTASSPMVMITMAAQKPQ